MGRISKYFPFDEFRDGQEQVINEIEEALRKDKHVLLGAAVGFGKSPVNMSVCNWSGNAFYTTPLKQLQDQLNNDFHEDIVMLKGRSNYPCFNNPELSAAHAPCATSGIKCEEKELCGYFATKYLAQESAIVCTNTSYMMVVPDSDERGGFSPREVLVVDEAHGLDEWALGFITLSLYESDVGMIPIYSDFDEYVAWIESITPKLTQKYAEIQENLDQVNQSSHHKIIVGLVSERDRIVSTLQKCNKLLDDYKISGEEWVFDIDTSTHGKHITFQPITSGRFLENMLWFRAKHIILSSATVLNPSSYLMDIGLEPSNVQVISVPNKFPVENRPFYYSPIGTVNRDSKDYLLPIIAEEIIELLESRYGQYNGIVHCHSYDNADILYEHLENTQFNIILQDRSNRDTSLRDWMEDKDPSLFLSVNFTEGVDLKDDLCRLQVGCKIGFPYLGDKRVQARKALKLYRCEKCNHRYRNIRGTCPECGNDDGIKISDDGEIWYACKAIETLIQSAGRAVRTPTDWAHYYMYDGALGYLLGKYGRYFPADFKESIINL